ncbi:Os05g0179050 [Oryza sativa Japonica Group]|uniref:Os05g0179050 protein n=1 Tax=Oryza sativa subsp. japonica TaxID=39947 RepID=A0A0N7KK89_ORYSJ|nr:Os05g0179050 [Oryza sativa Japonica Group]
MAGALVETPSISALQRGHSAFILSHLSTQSLWKKCAQGSSRRSSLSTYLAKQMQQTASSAEMTRSLFVPAATTPTPTSFPSPSRVFFDLNLHVPKALIVSALAPLFWFRSSRNPKIEIMQGRQQHINAQRMKGIA